MSFDTGGIGPQVGGASFGLGVDLQSFERDLDRAEALARARVARIQGYFDTIRVSSQVASNFSPGNRPGGGPASGFGETTADLNRTIRQNEQVIRKRTYRLDEGAKPPEPVRPLPVVFSQQVTIQRSYRATNPSLPQLSAPAPIRQIQRVYFSWQIIADRLPAVPSVGQFGSIDRTQLVRVQRFTRTQDVRAPIATLPDLPTIRRIQIVEVANVYRAIQGQVPRPALLPPLQLDQRLQVRRFPVVSTVGSLPPPSRELPSAQQRQRVTVNRELVLGLRAAQQLPALRAPDLELTQLVRLNRIVSVGTQLAIPRAANPPVLELTQYAVITRRRRLSTVQQPLPAPPPLPALTGRQDYTVLRSGHVTGRVALPAPPAPPPLTQRQQITVQQVGISSYRPAALPPTPGPITEKQLVYVTRETRFIAVQQAQLPPVPIPPRVPRIQIIEINQQNQVRSAAQLTAPPSPVPVHQDRQVFVNQHTIVSGRPLGQPALPAPVSQIRTIAVRDIISQVGAKPVAPAPAPQRPIFDKQILFVERTVRVTGRLALPEPAHLRPISLGQELTVHEFAKVVPAPTLPAPAPLTPVQQRRGITVDNVVRTIDHALPRLPAAPPAQLNQSVTVVRHVRVLNATLPQLPRLPGATLDQIFSVARRYQLGPRPTLPPLPAAPRSVVQVQRIALLRPVSVETQRPAPPAVPERVQQTQFIDISRQVRTVGDYQLPEEPGDLPIIRRFRYIDITDIARLVREAQLPRQFALPIPDLQISRVIRVTSRFVVGQLPQPPQLPGFRSLPQPPVIRQTIRIVRAYVVTEQRVPIPRIPAPAQLTQIVSIQQVPQVHQFGRLPAPPRLPDIDEEQNVLINRVVRLGATARLALPGADDIPVISKTQELAVHRVTHLVGATPRLPTPSSPEPVQQQRRLEITEIPNVRRAVPVQDVRRELPSASQSQQIVLSRTTRVVQQAIPALPAELPIARQTRHVEVRNALAIGAAPRIPELPAFIRANITRQIEVAQSQHVGRQPDLPRLSAPPRIRQTEDIVVDRIPRAIDRRLAAPPTQLPINQKEPVLVTREYRLLPSTNNLVAPLALPAIDLQQRLGVSRKAELSGRQDLALPPARRQLAIRQIQPVQIARVASLYGAPPALPVPNTPRPIRLTQRILVSRITEIVRQVEQTDATTQVPRRLVITEVVERRRVLAAGSPLGTGTPAPITNRPRLPGQIQPQRTEIRTPVRQSRSAQDRFEEDLRQHTETETRRAARVSTPQAPVIRQLALPRVPVRSLPAPSTRNQAIRQRTQTGVPLSNAVLARPLPPPALRESQAVIVDRYVIVGQIPALPAARPLPGLRLIQQVTAERIVRVVEARGYAATAQRLPALPAPPRQTQRALPAGPAQAETAPQQSYVRYYHGTTEHFTDVDPRRVSLVQNRGYNLTRDPSLADIYAGVSHGAPGGNLRVVDVPSNFRFASQEQVSAARRVSGGEGFVQNLIAQGFHGIGSPSRDYENVSIFPQFLSRIRNAISGRPEIAAPAPRQTALARLPAPPPTVQQTQTIAITRTARVIETQKAPEVQRTLPAARQTQQVVITRVPQIVNRQGATNEIENAIARTNLQPRHLQFVQSIQHAEEPQLTRVMLNELRTNATRLRQTSVLRQLDSPSYLTHLRSRAASVAGLTDQRNNILIGPDQTVPIEETLPHEVGHTVYNNLPESLRNRFARLRDTTRRVRGQGPELPPTRRSRLNDQEDFAETFRLHIQGGQGVDVHAEEGEDASAILGEQRANYMLAVERFLVRNQRAQAQTRGPAIRRRGAAPRPAELPAPDPLSNIEQTLNLLPGRRQTRRQRQIIEEIPTPPASVQPERQSPAQIPRTQPALPGAVDRPQLALPAPRPTIQQRYSAAQVARQQTALPQRPAIPLPGRIGDSTPRTAQSIVRQQNEYGTLASANLYYRQLTANGMHPDDAAERVQQDLKTYPTAHGQRQTEAAPHTISAPVPSTQFTPDVEPVASTGGGAKPPIIPPKRPTTFAEPPEQPDTPIPTVQIYSRFATPEEAGAFQAQQAQRTRQQQQGSQINPDARQEAANSFYRQRVAQGVESAKAAAQAKQFVGIAPDLPEAQAQPSQTNTVSDRAFIAAQRQSQREAESRARIEGAPYVRLSDRRLFAGIPDTTEGRASARARVEQQRRDAAEARAREREAERPQRPRRSQAEVDRLVNDLGLGEDRQPRRSGAGGSGGSGGGLFGGGGILGTGINQTTLRVGAALFGGVGLGLNVVAGIAKDIHQAVASAVADAAQINRSLNEIGIAYGQLGSKQIQAGSGVFAADPTTRGTTQQYLQTAAALQNLSSQYGLSAQQIQSLITASGQLARIHGTDLPTASAELQRVLGGDAEAAQNLGVNLTDEYGRLKSVGISFSDLTSLVGRARAEQILFADVQSQVAAQQSRSASSIDATTASLDKIAKQADIAKNALAQLVAKPVEVVVNVVANVAGGFNALNQIQNAAVQQSSTVHAIGAPAPQIVPVAPDQPTTPGGALGNRARGIFGGAVDALANAGAIDRRFASQQQRDTAASIPTPVGTGSDATAPVTAQLSLAKPAGETTAQRPETAPPPQQPIQLIDAKTGQPATAQQQQDFAKSFAPALVNAPPLIDQTADAQNNLSTSTDKASASLNAQITVVESLRRANQQLISQPGNIASIENFQKQIGEHQTISGVLQGPNFPLATLAPAQINALAAQQAAAQTLQQQAVPFVASRQQNEVRARLEADVARANPDRGDDRVQSLNDFNRREDANRTLINAQHQQALAQNSVQQAQLPVDQLQIQSEQRRLSAQSQLNDLALVQIQLQDSLAPALLQEADIRDRITLASQQNLDLTLQRLRAEQAAQPASNALSDINFAETEATQRAVVAAVQRSRGETPSFDLRQQIDVIRGAAFAKPEAELANTEAQRGVELAGRAERADQLQRQINVIPLQQQEQNLQPQILAGQAAQRAAQAQADALQRSLQVSDLGSGPQRIEAETALLNARLQEVNATGSVASAQADVAGVSQVPSVTVNLTVPGNIQVDQALLSQLADAAGAGAIAAITAARASGTKRVSTDVAGGR